MNIEGVHRHINIGSYNFNRQEWVQLGVYWNIRLNNRFEIAAGPNYNAFFARKSDPQYAENRGKIFPSFVNLTQYGNGNSVADMWLGGNVALRVRLNK